MATTDPAPLTLRRLEDHLWQAADLFRNKVSNQKDYILALLFFKRASDLYKEELVLRAREDKGRVQVHPLAQRPRDAGGRVRTRCLLERLHLRRAPRLAPLRAPGCDRRATRLYLEAPNLVCRACARVRYRTQTLEREDRRRLRAEKIRERLGAPADASLPQKPKGMPSRCRRRPSRSTTTA